MPLLPTWFALAVLFVVGLLFGSFANVVIWRFPRGESLSFPGSHCPSCDAPIGWRDNIPVVSWLLLRGRCRACDEPISGRYPLVELLSGFLWLLAWTIFGLSAQVIVAIAFFYLLLILAFIDLDTRRLPNTIVGLTFAIGAAAAVAAQLTSVRLVPLVAPSGSGWLSQPLVAAVVGAAVGSGIAMGIAALYAAIRRTQGFGMGDVKLLAAMGLYLGPYVLMALFVGSLFGAIYGLADAARENERINRHAFPFGPFLALGGVLTVWFGSAVWTWYLGLIG